MANIKITYKYPGHIDGRTICKPDLESERAANTAGLMAAAARLDQDQKIDVFFPPGRWCFNKLPMNTIDNVNVMDNITLRGAGFASYVQHLQEGNGQGTKYRTLFDIALDNHTDIWWDHIRPWRFGPVLIQDIAFVRNKGSLFSIGNIADVNVNADATIRGLRFENIYSSSQFNYNSGNVGDGRAWIINAGADGWVLNRVVQGFDFRLHRCFDTKFINVEVWGGKYGLVAAQNDRLVLNNFRGANGGKLLDEYSDAGLGSHHVGSQVNSVFGEHFCFPDCLHGQYAQYSKEYPSYHVWLDGPRPGNYDLPASVTWSIAAGTNEITFTFAGAYNCLDYFEPRCSYTFTPVNSGFAFEQAKTLFVYKVEANKLYFTEADNKCYFARNVAGIGTGVIRHFYGSGIGVGDRFRCDAPSIRNNENTTGMPRFFFVPGTRSIKWGDNSELPDQSQSATNLPRIIGHCVGKQFALKGDVDFLGSTDYSLHPLANAGGIGPEVDDNFRAPYIDYCNNKQLYTPGRGQGRGPSGLANLKLTYFWFVDPEDNKNVPWIRLSDDEFGWAIERIRFASRTTRYEARIYQPTGTGRFGVYGGAGAINWHVVPNGFSTVKGTSHTAVGGGSLDAVLTGTTQFLGTTMHLQSLNSLGTSPTLNGEYTYVRSFLVDQN